MSTTPLLETINKALSESTQEAAQATAPTHRYSPFEVWRDVKKQTPYWLREPTEEEKRTHDRLDDLQINGHKAIDAGLPPLRKGLTRSWHR